MTGNVLLYLLRVEREIDRDEKLKKQAGVLMSNDN